MFFSSLMGSQGAATGATIPSASFSRVGDPTWGIIYSGVQFNSDGNVYARQLGGGWGLVGKWMLNGASSSYHIHRTITGTLTTDAGDDLVLSTSRVYDVQNSAPSTTVTASVLFRISNVADSVTYDTATYAFSAEMESA